MLQSPAEGGRGTGGSSDGGSGNFAPGWYQFGVVAREARRMNSDPSDDGVSRQDKPVLPPSIRDHNLPSPPPLQRKPAVMQEPVLVLNATFEPINVTAVRRAMVLLLKGVAQAEELNHHEVHSTSRIMKVPSVIRLLAYRHIPQQTRALSRKNILLRDRNTCQFCGGVFPASELTLDHVVPRSRGGRSSWENLVACCYQCNNRKGDRTPEEAGIKLARRPRPFTLYTSRQLMRLIGHRDEKWRKYLFY